MTDINTASNISAPDDLYRLLAELHDGLEPDRINLVSARLILLLANQIGDMGVLREAIALARGNGGHPC